MNFRSITCFLILLSYFQIARGQFYNTGQPPSSVNWQQIRTPGFTLIFPESFSDLAWELAALLEDSRRSTGHTLNHRPGPVPVIVHNHNSRQNGLVAWAPKRMELYPVPSQAARGGDWLNRLVVHEQRHVVQLDKLNQGMTRFLSIILGEQATGIAAARLPLWFLEGDAVVTETTLTNSGRGREASFEMPLRALLLSESPLFSYDKYLFGSFRDFVPDYYQYGYQMVSALRREYGPEIWENTVDFLARWPLHPAPFDRSLRKQTGKGLMELNKITLSRIGEEWGTEGGGQEANGNFRLNRRITGHYHSYRYPVWLDSAVIAYKTGIARISELVKIDLDGKEQRLIQTGSLSAPSLTVAGNRIAWSEYRSDPRWHLRQYSVIKVFDMDTGKERRISSKTRFFAPAFSPDRLFLAVVEVDLQNRNFISLVNSVTGEVAARYPAPPGKNLQQPAFSSSGKEILVTTVCDNGSGIMALDMESGGWFDIFTPAFVNISGVFSCGELICFHSDNSGIDNLHAIDKNGETIYQVTNSAFGAFDGNLSGPGMLVWSEYTADGFDLVVSEFNELELPEYESSYHIRNELVESLASHEMELYNGKLSDTLWPVEPYRKGLNLFRFHSWAPFYYNYRDFNVYEQPLYPGISLLSQDLLGTANTFAGYSYRDGRHIVHGNFIYRGWYPVLEAGFDYGDRSRVFMGRDSIGPLDSPSRNQLNFNGSVSVPLHLSDGSYFYGTEPLLRVNYNNSLYHYNRDNSYKRGMTTIQARLLAYRLQRRSHRDLAPRWGQVFRWQMRSAPFESENIGVINAVEVTLYFPGFAPHHSLGIDAGYQWQDPVKYYYNSIIGFPRGYPLQTTERLQVVRGSYLFPVLYPDYSIPGILYLKRVNGRLFADAGKNSIRKINQQATGLEWHNENLFSWGSGLTANVHLFRFLFPFNIGGGFAHIPSRGEFSLLFSVGMNLPAD
jgi:hypothetical protein